MKLILSNSQQFLDKVDSFRFQSWSIEDISMKGNIFVNSMDNLYSDDTRHFILSVQDIIQTNTNPYKELYLETSVIYESELNDWLVLPADLNQKIPHQNFKIPFSISINSSKLIEGYHNATIVYEVIGKKTEVGQVLATYKQTFTYKILPAGNFFFPQQINIQQNEGERSSRELEVSGNNWILTASQGVVILDEKNVFLKTLSGSGYKKVRLAVNLDELDKKTTTHISSIGIKYREISYSLPINIFLFDDYTPKKIIFNASSGLIDKPKQTVFFSEAGDFTLRYPYWVKAKVIEGIPRQLEIEIPSANNFGTGQFDNSVSMVFANRKIEIPITLNCFDGFNLGIKNNEVVFAENTPLILFSTNESSSHLEIDFILDEDQKNIFNFSYKIPYFQSKAEFSIAEILRRQMFFKNYWFKNFIKNNLPSLSLSIREINNSQIIKEYSKKGIPVINGQQPKRILAGMSILNNTTAERFTRLGVAVINVMALSGSFDYSIRLNNKIAETYKGVIGALRSIYINFKAYKEGDSVEFVLHTPEGDIEKTFIVIPQTLHSTTIYYRNSHGLTSSIEFTGEVKIDVEKRRKIEKYSDNGEFKSRSFLEDTQDKLSINTGYLFLDQFREVNDLLNSPEAFFYQDNERFVLIPISEKITKYNSQDFLQSYQIEFLINDINYAQVHF